MKKIGVIIGACFGVITACLVYILNKGVSLRSAPVIGPTLLSVGENEIARSLVVRLTSEFQNASFVIFGIDGSDQFSLSLIDKMKTEYIKDFKTAPMIVSANDSLNCSICWIIVPRDQANQLAHNQFIDSRIKPTQKKYFTISFLKFSRNVTVPQECESQQRITFNCLTPLAVRESQRKFKEQSRYFFVRKYNESDYFFFLEN